MRIWFLAPLLGAIALRAQPTPALQQLNTYLNNIGIAQGDQRAVKVTRIKTRSEAEKRQIEVRNKILGLIGGLPEKYGPVRFKAYGSLPVALEPRISAAATACFITSLNELFPTQGPQEAEQTLPLFSANGLDFGDWVELVAPRPCAIVFTTADMFPYTGAKQTCQEAKRFYALLGAEDKLQWITGPGGRGNLGPIANQILGFLVKNLRGDAPVPEYKQFPSPDPDDLTATPGGQISVSLHSKTAEDFTRAHAQKIIYAPERIASQSALKAFQDRIRTDIRAVSAAEAQPGSAPAVNISKQEQRDGYRQDTVTISSEPGIELTAVQAIPSTPGPHATVILVDEIPIERIAAASDFTRLAKSGHIVVALQVRGAPVDAQNGESQQFALGPYMGVNLRAIILGKTLVGTRADDMIRSINRLEYRPNIDRASLTLYAKSGPGMAALHAAALDDRITNVIVENSLLSYKTALDAPLHRNLSGITIPGVLKHYHVPDLLEAIAPRKVILLNPTGPVGQAERADEVRDDLPFAFDTDKALGYPNRIQVLKCGFRDPLPIE